MAAVRNLTSPPPSVGAAVRLPPALPLPVTLPGSSEVDRSTDVQPNGVEVILDPEAGERLVEGAAAAGEESSPLISLAGSLPDRR